MSQGQPAPLRVQALVALRLLEVIRDSDLPGEVLEEEDPTRTMPRRFGLSDVVGRQIRTYKEDVRKHIRLSDEEIQGLFRFVIRRPDGNEIFERAGSLLIAPNRQHYLSRMLSQRIRIGLARRFVKRRLRRLFGRHIVGFRGRGFVLEGRALVFTEDEPVGGACHLISGFYRQVIEQVVGVRASVVHTKCQSRADSICRWELEILGPPKVGSES